MADATKTFEYAVRDRGGKIVKGRIEAPNQAAVANRLRSMGLATVSISEVSSGGLQREIKLGSGSGVKTKDLAIMARQMATMVSAGLSLLRTLSILADQTENPALAKVLAQVRGEVETGVALSVAFAKHKDVFPPLMINIVRAGEVGGFLEKALLSVAENYEAEVKLRAKIKSAMTYPVMVFIMAIVAVTIMLIFIVPVFKKMYEGLGSHLPAPTMMLVYASNVVKWTVVPFVIALIVFMSWWKKHKNDESVRQKVDPWRLKLPIFGKLTKKIVIARFSRNFGTMVGAGVPLLQALDIVGETSGNYVVERALADVKDSVRQGESLAGPLAHHEVFPAMVQQMIAVGEDSGALEVMLEKIGEFYDQEVEAMTEQLTSLIEPLMIAFLGVIVGGMIICLYLPIFNIANAVSGS